MAQEGRQVGAEAHGLVATILTVVAAWAVASPVSGPFGTITAGTLVAARFAFTAGLAILTGFTLGTRFGARLGLGFSAKLAAGFRRFGGGCVRFGTATATASAARRTGFALRTRI